MKGIGSNIIPTDPERNTAGVTAKTLLKLSKRNVGLKIEIYKGVRPGSGLGSSAASAAATAVALNKALGLNMARTELIEIAAMGEVASAGVAHADNVSSAILGFFNLVRSYDPLRVVNMRLPENAGFAIAIPNIYYNTGRARAILPRKVSLSDLTCNVGYASTFIAGIALKDVNLMGEGMKDRIIEPARARLIPGLKHVKEAALNAGAAGVTISGAGPSIIALVNTDRADMKEVAKAMREAFREKGIKSDVICSRTGPGAQIVRAE